MKSIHRCGIYPAIGVARVGNSPKGSFLAREVPDSRLAPRTGFKDSMGRVKRQVARFRVYGFDRNGKVVAEVTPEIADIEWTVHVANGKGAWYRFSTPLDIPGAEPALRRNQAHAGELSELIIDPGPRTLKGPSQRARFGGGTFLGEEVHLGKAETDARGRLLVYGGRGRSEGIANAPITGLNNDGWFDDVSDGPVTATVAIGGRKIPVDSAWVVVGPPDFAPGVRSPVTMYDVVLDTAERAGWLPFPDPPSFMEHIYTVLGQVCELQWVNAGMNLVHGYGSTAHFMHPETLTRLADPSPAARPFRTRVFRHFRKPGYRRSNPHQCPQIYGDGVRWPLNKPAPNKWLTVTSYQYRCLEKWERGEFIDDYRSERPSPRLSDLPLEERPHALTRAALEGCLGGPFHPGCELTWPMRHVILYEDGSPFRVKHLAPRTPPRSFGRRLEPEEAVGAKGPLNGSGPGDLTRWMAVPWQIDTANCGSGYEPEINAYLPTLWPARVPNQVLTEGAFARVVDPALPDEERAKYLTQRADWLRNYSMEHGALARGELFLAGWYRAGIIRELDNPAPARGVPERLQVEMENGFERKP